MSDERPEVAPRAEDPVADPEGFSEETVARTVDRALREARAKGSLGSGEPSGGAAPPPAAR